MEPTPTPAARRMRSRAVPAVLVAIGVVALGLWALRPVITNVVANQLRAAAADRHLAAQWSRLDVGLGTARIDDLSLSSSAGDTVLVVRHLSIAIAPLSMLVLRPRPGSITLDDARFTLRPGSASDSDTLDPTPPPAPSARRGRTDHPERSRRLVTAVRQAVRLLFVPAHQLPRVRITNLTVAQATARTLESREASRRVDIDTLTADPTAGGIRLGIHGVLRANDAVPFSATATYGRDDRLTGRARFALPAARGGERETLSIAIDGALTQDRRARVARLGGSTHVSVGALPIGVAGTVWQRGPRFEIKISADSVTSDQVHRSLPASLLGPLLDVSTRGSFDYRLHFDLDLARPEEVDFTADVIPHALRLDRATRLRLTGLGAPFTAVIHLPRHTTTRVLSPANPHFRALDDIDSLLTHAVVTNEDGGFFRHRGFNTEAVKQSIAENLRAGAFRRGAGTITMQLARNLYLGHQRTLARKMQEVVLAWVLEHLTGVGKRRLLEIYFNIIEWGPGIHGADEAAHYYFGRNASRLTIDESLFLATIVPAPLKWRYRLDAEGALRPFARAQMHFIGRAMIAKGWLEPSALSAPDMLRVELRGPARDVLFPPAPGTTRTVEALLPFLP